MFKCSFTFSTWSTRMPFSQQLESVCFYDFKHNQRGCITSEVAFWLLFVEREKKQRQKRKCKWRREQWKASEITLVEWKARWDFPRYFYTLQIWFNAIEKSRKKVNDLIAMEDKTWTTLMDPLEAGLKCANARCWWKLSRVPSLWYDWNKDSIFPSRYWYKLHCSKWDAKRLVCFLVEASLVE